MTLAEANAAIRANGVTWRPCQECGRDWPFPNGPAVVADFRCHVCLEAENAAIRRGSMAT